MPKSYWSSFLNPPFQGVLEMDVFYQVCEHLLDQYQNVFWNEYVNNLYVTKKALNQDLNLLEPREAKKTLSDESLKRYETIFSLKENQGKGKELRNEILHAFYCLKPIYNNQWIHQFLIGICGVGNYRILQDNVAYTYTISLTKSAMEYQDLIHDLLWDKIPANFIFQVVLEIVLWKELQIQWKGKTWGDLQSYTWKEIETLDVWDPSFRWNWGDYRNQIWISLKLYTWKNLGEK